MSANAAPDQRSESPSLIDGADGEPPVDHESQDEDAGSCAGSDVQMEEELGDLGGDEDDGNDDDPHKYIDKSAHYKDLEMTKRHAAERVEFFKGFALKCSKGKHPHKKIKVYEARLKRATDRLEEFREMYATKRAVAKKSRHQRAEQLKASREAEDALGKKFKQTINKGMRKNTAIAAKAAIAALKTLAEDATEEAKEQAVLAAYSSAMLGALKDTPLTTEEAGASDEEKAPEKPVEKAEKVAKPPKVAKVAKASA
jgi:fructose/tagatose bisphosphate aldolase